VVWFRVWCLTIRVRRWEFVVAPRCRGDFGVYTYARGWFAEWHLVSGEVADVIVRGVGANFTVFPSQLRRNWRVNGSGDMPYSGHGSSLELSWIREDWIGCSMKSCRGFLSVVSLGV
jgi:hypothetical protein